jgi:hypothetical protein
MDLFTTMVMLGIITQAGPAPTFLRDMFFSHVETHDTAKIALDYEHEGRVMAPFVSGSVAGKVYERGSFSTSTFEAPYVQPKFITNAEDFITKRLAGEPVTGALSPMVRAAQQLGKDLGLQDRMITRREEWMVAQLLFTGTCPIVGEGVKADLTFWTPGNAKAPYAALASDAQWDKDTADIYETLRAAQEKAVDDSGVQPDVCIFAKDVAAVVLKNKGLRELLDVRRIEMGSIQPKLLPDGVQYIGTITALDLDLYTYTGKHDNGTGTLVDYVPAKHFLMGPSGSRAPAIMNYGVVALGNEKTDTLEYIVGRRVPESWVTRAPAGRTLQTKSRPLPVVTKPGAFQVRKVLA